MACRCRLVPARDPRPAELSRVASHVPFRGPGHEGTRPCSSPAASLRGQSGLCGACSDADSNWLSLGCGALHSCLGNRAAPLRSADRLPTHPLPRPAGRSSVSGAPFSESQTWVSAHRRGEKDEEDAGGERLPEGACSRRLVNGGRAPKASCRPLEGALVQLCGTAQPMRCVLSPSSLIWIRNHLEEAGLILVYVRGVPNPPQV